MKGAGLDMVFEGLYRSQSAWDEVMGANAVRGAESEGRRLVVCAGSGHLLYNLGLNRRAYERSKLPFKTVIAVEVPAGKKTLLVSRTIGDYVFGLPEEEKPAFPTIGLGFKKVENLENLVIDAKPTDGAASRADFEKGDVVLSVDGKAYTDINEIRFTLARMKCGDEVKFKVLRAGQVKDVAAQVREENSRTRRPRGEEPMRGRSTGGTMKTKNVKILVSIILGLAFGPAIVGAQGKAAIPTPAEETGYREYTQNEAIAAFLSALDARSPELTVQTVGRSLPTDEYGAQDIFLAVLSEKPAATPEALDRAKPDASSSRPPSTATSSRPRKRPCGSSGTWPWATSGRSSSRSTSWSCPRQIPTATS